MFRICSLRPAPAPIVHVDDDVHWTYESYAVSEEPSLQIPVEDDTRPSGVRRESGTAGLALQPLLD